MKLEQRLREAIRAKGYAINTEKSYVMRYLQYVGFTKDRCGEFVHPGSLTSRDVEAYLSFLSNQKDVSPATQRSALSALKFLYEEVLGIELGELRFAVARRRQKLPVVLSFNETQHLLSQFSGKSRLQSELMYGCGLRISECVTVRIKDLDLACQTLAVSQTKGGKSRILMLPNSVLDLLKKQIEVARKRYAQDRESGGLKVSMPGALNRKASSWASSWE